MNILLLISLAASAVSCIFSQIYQFQMLQQNSYFPSRYFSWLKNSYTIPLSVNTLLFCLSSVLFLWEKYVLQLVLILCTLLIRIALCIKNHRSSIKKLVFTARIKRLIITASALFLILISLYCAFPSALAGEISAVVLFALTLVPPITTMIIWVITSPVETAVKVWYINDAKRILRQHPQLKVIGITGSYGKTTTKFILERMLSEKFNTVCTPQSFNTPMGVVRTIRNSIKPRTQIFICEMGAKKVGDIKEICKIAHPQYGIITSVGPQHLDTFRNIDNIFNTKFELADEVTHNGGNVFVNTDSEVISQKVNLSNNCIIPFGDGTEYYAENISCGPKGSTFDLVLKNERISVTTRLLGAHSVSDIVAAAALAHKLGLAADDIKFSVSCLKPTEHRLELKNFRNGSLIIDDAYNSNPVGCIEAVRVLSSFDGMQKAIITPGLVELGEREYDCNFALGLEAAKHCDIIILVGKTRSKPMLDAIATTDFDKNNLYVVSSFAEGMEIYTPTAGQNSVLLIENDLPDNYLN